MQSIRTLFNSTTLDGSLAGNDTDTTAHGWHEHTQESKQLTQRTEDAGSTADSVPVHLSGGNSTKSGTV